MIHSSARLNDLSPSPAEPPHFTLPAEYYESPQTTRIVPRWVPFGCGGAALLFLVMIVGVAVLVSGGRGGRFLDSLFGSMQNEINGQFTKDVTADQRKAFNDAFGDVRAKVRVSKLNLEKMQPLLQTIRDVQDDNRITPAEAERLTAAARQARGK